MDKVILEMSTAFVVLAKSNSTSYKLSGNTKSPLQKFLMLDFTREIVSHEITCEPHVNHKPMTCGKYEKLN